MSIQKNRTILITGGCGFVGKHLVNHILENNLYNKVLVCCHRKEQQQQFDNRIIFVKADLLNPAGYDKIFRKYHPNEIIHLAAIAQYRQGEENPEETVAANLFGTIRLIELARQYGVSRFLFVSSNLARNPKGVTGATKYLAEAFIKTINEPPVVCSIRLPNVIDSPGAVTLIFKRQIEAGETITITDKRMTRKFITPEQSAKDLIFALSTGKHQDIFINNKPSTPIIKLAQQMIARSGKQIPVEFIGMRPGEKLLEEDYPAETIAATAHQNLFLLTEEQHRIRNIKTAIGLLNGKVSQKLLAEINLLFKINKQ